MVIWRLGAMLTACLAATVMLSLSPQPASSFPAPPLAGSAQLAGAGGTPEVILASSGSRRIYRPRHGHYHGGYNRPGHWNGHRPWNGNVHRPWHYNPYYHGHRYHYRYPGYGYFYGGFWYAQPWWLYGAYHARPVGGSAHKRWCIEHYRSYNPATNLYVGKDGKRHSCDSPYD